jgi:hypothetical protein
LDKYDNGHSRMNTKVKAWPWKFWIDISQNVLNLDVSILHIM